MSGRKIKLMRKQYKAATTAIAREALEEIVEDLHDALVKWRVIGIVGWLVALLCGLAMRMDVWQR